MAKIPYNYSDTLPNYSNALGMCYFHAVHSLCNIICPCITLINPLPKTFELTFFVGNLVYYPSEKHGVCDIGRVYFMKTESYYLISRIGIIARFERIVNSRRL